MPTEDKQIQVWAKPTDHRPCVVFGARCVGAGRGRIQWNFWRRDGDGFSSIGGSIHDALEGWAVGGKDSSWYDVEIVAAPASIAAKYVDQPRAAWRYDQRWWWCNSGTDKGQIGTSASLRNVARVDAVENFRCYLQDPHSWTMESRRPDRKSN